MLRLLCWLTGEARTLLLGPGNQASSRDLRLTQKMQGDVRLQGPLRALSPNSGAHGRLPESLRAAESPGQPPKLHAGVVLLRKGHWWTWSSSLSAGFYQAEGRPASPEAAHSNA